jgi:hypothetical protein
MAFNHDVGDYFAGADTGAGDGILHQWQALFNVEYESDPRGGQLGNGTSLHATSFPQASATLAFYGMY